IPCASRARIDLARSHKGGRIMDRRGLFLAVVLVATAVGVAADEKKDADWEGLFNGKDTTGWKLRGAKVTRTTFIHAEGKPIAGARRGKVDQKEVIRDAKGKEIADAKVIEKDGKKVIIDAEGKPIEKAKIAKVGGRDAIVIGKGEEVKGAKAVNEVV